MAKSLATFNINSTVLERWKKNNEKRNFSQLIEEYMQSMNDEDEKSKKVNAPAKDAINIFNSDTNKYLYTNKNKNQTTLDIFAKVKEINSFLENENDIDKLGQIRRNAHTIEAIAKTKIIKIGKGLI